MPEYGLKSRIRRWYKLQRSCDWAWYFVCIAYGTLFLVALFLIFFAPCRSC
jgi:hypothetical protein